MDEDPIRPRNRLNARKLYKPMHFLVRDETLKPASLRGELKPISEIVAKLKTKHTRMADQIEFLETHNQIYYCEACGEVLFRPQTTRKFRSCPTERSATNCWWNVLSGYAAAPPFPEPQLNFRMPAVWDPTPFSATSMILARSI